MAKTKEKEAKAPTMKGTTKASKKELSEEASPPEAGKKEKKWKSKEITVGDILAGTSMEVEKLTQEGALDLAPILINSAGANDFKLGGVLARIQVESWWEGGEHESFKSYVEGVLGLQYRKCMYLINIYETLLDAGVEWSDVSAIGWSKLRFIVNHLTTKNAKEWSKRCGKMNALEIQDYVKGLEQKKAGKAGKDDAEVTTKKLSSLSFKVHPDQKEIITEAVNKSKVENDTEFASVALETICLSYVDGTSGKVKKATKKAVVEFLKGLGAEKAADLLTDIYPELSADED